jgi:hypothetical protein
MSGGRKPPEVECFRPNRPGSGGLRPPLGHWMELGRRLLQNILVGLFYRGNHDDSPYRLESEY